MSDFDWDHASRSEVLALSKEIDTIKWDTEEIQLMELKFQKGLEKNVTNKSREEKESLTKVINRLSLIRDNPEKFPKLINRAIFIEKALKICPKIFPRQEIKSLLQNFIEENDDFGARGARYKETQVFVFSYYFDLLFALLPMSEYIPKKKNLELCKSIGYDACLQIKIDSDFVVYDLGGKLHNIKQCDQIFPCGEKMKPKKCETFTERNPNLSPQVIEMAKLILDYIDSAALSEKKYTSYVKITKYVKENVSTEDASFIQEAIKALVQKGFIISKRRSFKVNSLDKIKEEIKIVHEFWKDAKESINAIRETLLSTCEGFGWELMSDDFLQNLVDNVLKTLTNENDDEKTKRLSSTPNPHYQYEKQKDVSIGPIHLNDEIILDEDI